MSTQKAKEKDEKKEFRKHLVFSKYAFSKYQQLNKTLINVFSKYNYHNNSIVVVISSNAVFYHLSNTTFSSD